MSFRPFCLPGEFGRPDNKRAYNTVAGRARWHIDLLHRPHVEIANSRFPAALSAVLSAVF